MAKQTQIFSGDKKLAVFHTGTEKPPTFCHLSNDSQETEMRLQQYMAGDILTTVPWPQRPGTPAVWLPWPETACWAMTVRRQT